MTRIVEPKPPVVVLVGFMGTGKTEVGRALASLLDVEFVDTDALVESRAGMTVAEIFERHGEARFRELESDVCRALSPEGGAVVATGGGALLDEANADHVAALGPIVLLEASFDEIVARLENGEGRPLLTGTGEDDDHAALLDRVESLLEARRPVYDRIQSKVYTTNRAPEEVAAEIASGLEPPCRVIHMDVDTRPVKGLSAGTGNGGCRIVIGRGAASRAGTYLAEAGLRSRAFLFVPKQLRKQFAGVVRPSLAEAGIPHEVVPVADGDANKNLAQVRDLLDRLAASGAGSDSTVVSVGGGVTGDVAGFVAATYMRGIPFVQMPTTLINQVDASIGGKVGVNHPRAKNLIGAIYQPQLVLSDPLLLETLPMREISNGMAEVVKTAIIGSPSLYAYIVSALDHPAEEKLPDPKFLEFCVFECARIKSEIVERDPYEQDLRRILNLGHTLGHALESALEYEGIKHGEAVALGTIAAIRLSVDRGRAKPALLERTLKIFEWSGLPTRMPPVDRDQIRSALKFDKKAKDGNLFFVLPTDVGHVETVGDVTEDELLAVV
jgi:3-dehydroquinate synthase